ncbi:MAG: DUF1614 domain-containing protein [Gemmataceae bacterium]
MNGDEGRSPPSYVPLLGCLTLALVVLFLCLLPFFLVELMQRALEKLHLSPGMAFAMVMGIFVGGLFNIPIYHIPRVEEQTIEPISVYGALVRSPQQVRRVRRDTIIAINVGGAIVPMGLLIYLLIHLIQDGGWPLAAFALAGSANIAICYFAARPIGGIGIFLPGYVAPLVAVVATWILLPGGEYESVRAPVAFCAGVLGPLVGADALHLRDILRVPVGMLSIGGAGTFDGIVLAGVLAAFLA